MLIMFGTKLEFTNQRSPNNRWITVHDAWKWLCEPDALVICDLSRRDRFFTAVAIEVFLIHTTTLFWLFLVTSCLYDRSIATFNWKFINCRGSYQIIYSWWNEFLLWADELVEYFMSTSIAMTVNQSSACGLFGLLVAQHFWEREPGAYSNTQRQVCVQSLGAVCCHSVVICTLIKLLERGLHSHPLRQDCFVKRNLDCVNQPPVTVGFSIIFDFIDVICISILVLAWCVILSWTNQTTDCMSSTVCLK